MEKNNNILRIAFISNYLNHHTYPLCQSLMNNNNVELRFIATQQTPNDKIKFGYSEMNNVFNFVIKTYESNILKKQAYLFLKECDVAIFDGVWGKYIKICKKNNVPTFRFSERFHKSNKYFFVEFLKSLKYKLLSYRDPNSLFIGAGYFALGDFKKTRYKNNLYLFGYFPLFEKEEEDILSSKQSFSMVWAGRFIDWKHPEYIIELAKEIKKQNVRAVINVIGDGPLLNCFLENVSIEKLNDIIVFRGPLPYSEVRTIMKKCDVHLFTSDQNEGWGAVLNESMNSYCAPIANANIGAASAMICDGVNGLLYDGSVDDFCNKVFSLINDKNLLRKIQVSAYKTVETLWNSDIAANRIIDFIYSLKNNEKLPIYLNGPLSKKEL